MSSRDIGPCISRSNTIRFLFAKKITALENMANLNQLPPKGFWIMALPMKIKSGSGAPLRIVAAIF
jgi:kynurenine formamidase